MLRLLLLALLCVSSEARAEWHRVETPGFIIRADLPEPELRTLGTQIEMLDLLLRAQTGVTALPDRRKIDILIVPDIETGARMTGVTDFAGGLTWPGSMGAFLIVAHRDPLLGAEYDMREVVFHEYAHGFMARYLGANQPGWFIEGFAMLFESARPLPDGKMEFGRFPPILAGYVDAKRPVDFRSIMSVSAGIEDKIGPIGLYSQGWVMTHHYYLGGPRAAEIGAYLSAVRKRQPVRPETLFKGGIAAFDADMAAWFAALPPPREIALPALAPERVTVRTMRPGEVALIEHQMEDFTLGSDVEDEKLVRRLIEERYAALRALYAKYPEPALGFYVAQFALMAFDLAGADKLLERLIAADPDNPDLLAYRGMVLVEIARETPERFEALIARSRTLIQRAITLDPASPIAAVAMFRNVSADQGATPAARQRLMRAIELNPEDTELLKTALEYAIRNNDTRGAIALLQPVANSPHDTPGRRFAIEWITRLRKNGTNVPRILDDLSSS